MRKTIGILCGCGLITLAIASFLQGHAIDGWFAWFVGLHYLRELVPESEQIDHVKSYGDLTKRGMPW